MQQKLLWAEQVCLFQNKTHGGVDGATQESNQENLLPNIFNYKLFVKIKRPREYKENAVQRTKDG